MIYENVNVWCDIFVICNVSEEMNTWKSLIKPYTSHTRMTKFNTCAYCSLNPPPPKGKSYILTHISVPNCTNPPSNCQTSLGILLLPSVTFVIQPKGSDKFMFEKNTQFAKAFSGCEGGGDLGGGAEGGLGGGCPRAKCLSIIHEINLTVFVSLTIRRVWGCGYIMCSLKFCCVLHPCSYTQ